MYRDQFINNTVAGVSLGNQNALSVFVWYSTFTNNGQGLSNLLPSGGGSFSVYNSNFSGSATYDIATAYIGGIRNNYSENSDRFAHIGASCALNNVTVQGNTIVNTTQSDSIWLQDRGAHVIFDNIIKSKVGATGPVIYEHASSCLTEEFLLGNTFTVSPYFQTDNAGHTHDINNSVVDRNTLIPTPPTLPGTPANTGPGGSNIRTIYEPAALTGAAIQTAINAAVAGATTKPVVHIPAGTYTVGATITTSANSDVQIIGDGYASLLDWTSGGAGPVLQINGPSRVTLRNFFVRGNAEAANGIEVNNADQTGSRVFIQGIYVARNLTSVFVDSLDKTLVDIRDDSKAFNIDVSGTAGLKVVGGPSAAGGTWLGGSTNLFSPTDSGNNPGYDVSNGAHVLLRDGFYDAGGAGGTVAIATGIGALTYAGSIFYRAADGTPGIALSGYQGKAAIINNFTNAAVTASGNGSGGSLLAVGQSFQQSTNYLSDTTSPADTMEFLNGQTNTSNETELNCCNNSFVTSVFSQYRTGLPGVISALPVGVTDVRIYAVSVQESNVGIHLKPN